MDLWKNQEKHGIHIYAFKVIIWLHHKIKKAVVCVGNPTFTLLC